MTSVQVSSAQGGGKQYSPAGPLDHTRFSAAPIDGRSFAAAQAFLLGTKTAWTTRVYPQLREDYKARVQSATAA